jgi:hypothetical protein
MAMLAVVVMETAVAVIVFLVVRMRVRFFEGSL